MKNIELYSDFNCKSKWSNPTHWMKRFICHIWYHVAVASWVQAELVWEKKISSKRLALCLNYVRHALPCEPQVSFIRLRFFGLEEKEATNELNTRERIRICCKLGWAPSFGFKVIPCWRCPCSGVFRKFLIQRRK